MAIPPVGGPEIPPLQDPVDMGWKGPKPIVSERTVAQKPNPDFPPIIKKALGNQVKPSSMDIAMGHLTDPKHYQNQKKISETPTKDLGIVGSGKRGNRVKTYVEFMLGSGGDAASLKGGENVANEINSYFGKDAHKKFYEAAQKMSGRQLEKMADFLEAMGEAEDHNRWEGQDTGREVMNEQLSKALK